uniref:Uncharacterized protein n=1 Tax=Heterorhabditis bacteriophora TaxID=37862 RepID=A0A1I7XG81_HETBA
MSDYGQARSEPVGRLDSKTEHKQSNKKEAVRRKSTRRRRLRHLTHPRTTVATKKFRVDLK